MHQTASTDLMDTQSKYQKVFCRCMRPNHDDPAIHSHPAFQTLLWYMTDGCPVQCGNPWTCKQLEEAIKWGPHILVTSPEAAAFLHNEAHKKEKLGHACIVHRNDTKDNTPTNLKISPVAAIEHKSCLYWSILNLLYKLRLQGVKMPSANETTIPMSNHKAMGQMGKSLWRLVATIGNTSHHNSPIMFAKWDIKEGFWQVLEDNTWHFAYVLPWLKETDPIKLVVPTCLQMGWCESLPLFVPVGLGNRNRATPTQNIQHTQQAELARTYQCNRQDLLEVYMGAFLEWCKHPPPLQIHSLCIPTTRTQQRPIQWTHLYQETQVMGWPLEHSKRNCGLVIWWSVTMHATTQQQSGKNTCTPHPNIKIKTSLPGQTRKTQWAPHACNNRHPKQMWAPIAAYSHHFHERRLNSEMKQALWDWKELLCTANMHSTSCTNLPPALAMYSWRHMVWYQKSLPPLSGALPSHSTYKTM